MVFKYEAQKAVNNELTPNEVICVVELAKTGYHEWLAKDKHLLKQFEQWLKEHDYV